MNQERDNGPRITQKYSAGIIGQFKGKVSNFNQFIIIALIANIILIFIFAKLTSTNPTVFSFYFNFIFFMLPAILLIGAFRYCFVKPGDETYPTSTSFVGVNRAIELRDLPPSLLTQELLSSVAGLCFIENEPPKGIIKGDITDDKSIQMLSEEDRRKLKEKEKQEIIEHQKNIKVQIETLSMSVKVKQPQVSTASEQAKE